jgi:hypothetical protein
MKSSLIRHFYLFKGNWSNIYDDLVEIIQPDNLQKFSIWEPHDKSKTHGLVIVYGMPLDESYCHSKNIWRTNDSTFNYFYLNNLERFNIHGTKHIVKPFEN